MAAAWQGVASVDSAAGTALHLALAMEKTDLGLSLVHPTAATADFPGFSGEAFDQLFVGLYLDSPYCAAGALGLAGLGQFLFRPAGTGPLIPVSGSRPARVQRPDGAGYRGFVLGSQAGLLAIHPRLEPSRLSSGAWFSPDGSPLSAMFLAGTEPGRVSEGWYEADTPRADRLWGAASIALVDKLSSCRLVLSGALAASLGLPGTDAAAARLETLVAFRRLRLEGEASFVSPGWRAPDGTAAVPVRLDLSVLYRYRALWLSGNYRLVRKKAGAVPAETTVGGQVRLADGRREAAVAYSLSRIPGQAAVDLTLDTRLKPGLAPEWLPALTAETAWKCSDGRSERFDLQAALKGGRAVSWSVAAGLRYDIQGGHAKASGFLQAPFGTGFLRFGLKSDGWLPLAGIPEEIPVVLFLGWSFSGP